MNTKKLKEKIENLINNDNSAQFIKAFDINIRAKEKDNVIIITVNGIDFFEIFPAYNENEANLCLYHLKKFCSVMAYLVTVGDDIGDE